MRRQILADRSYYRLESNARLIEEARDNPNRELAIVLGERLERASSWDDIDE